MGNVIGAAIFCEVPSGEFRGRLLGCVYLDRRGMKYLRLFALHSPDAALREAARALYELRRGEHDEPLPEVALDAELLGLAALSARDVEGGPA